MSTIYAIRDIETLKYLHVGNVTHYPAPPVISEYWAENPFKWHVCIFMSLEDAFSFSDTLDIRREDVIISPLDWNGL